MTCFFRRNCTLRGALKSAVIWTNAGIMALVPLIVDLHTWLPVVREFLPADIYRWAFLIVTAINILLRFKTKQPLAEKGQPSTETTPGTGPGEAP